MLENTLIRELKPRFNVDGAYSFLYPAIGIRHTPARTLLCFTTSVQLWAAFELRWFGVFRSRARAKYAFYTLVELLAMVGHLERSASLGARPDVLGSRLAGIRQLDASLVASLCGWLAGETNAGLTTLAHALLDRPRARRDAAQVAESLRELRAFYESDLRPLREALAEEGRERTFITQDERDLLFIRAR